MLKFFAFPIFVFVTVLTFSHATAAQGPIGGQVTEIVDGKTIVVTTPGGKVKVELQYIEVPDAGQELHDTVKTHLSTLLMGKVIEYRPKILLRGHAIGQVTVKGSDVSQQMLRDGAAWHRPRESSGQGKNEFDLYASLEAAAKNEKRGVWSNPDLKPAWEYRAERKKEKEILKEQYKLSFSPAVTATTGRRFKPQPAGNPAFGDVGSLVNRYDKTSRTGLLSTSYLPIEGNAPNQKMGMDVTYYYKENSQGKRDGTFVFTVYCLSGAPQFMVNNNLLLWENEKTKILGKPKRLASKNDMGVTETLIYKLDRATLERAAYNEGVFFKIGEHIIFFTGGRYLLYNLLQVTQ